MRDIVGEGIAREIDSKGARHQDGARFNGLYRGTCVDNVDDHGLRRCKIRIPEFYGEDPSAGLNPADLRGGLKTEDIPWAHPCLPPSLINSPAIGDSVWVCFEKGDPNRPVWLGIYPVAPINLRAAITTAFNFAKSFFVTQQSEGSIVPPQPAQLTDLDKTKSHANNYDIDARFLWALRLTENGRPGREFGVLGVASATDFDGQADAAAETVHNTLDRYQRNTGRSPIGQDGRYTPDFVKYFSRGGPGYEGYSAIGAANDPQGLNKNHLTNLTKNYALTEFN